VLDVINPAVHQTLSQVHATDPVPPHPPSAHSGSALNQKGSTP
jgi:hypothetical protein